MINIYVQRLIMMAFSMWPYYKAENFADHMHPILYQHKLEHWQVNYWATLFAGTRRYQDLLEKVDILCFKDEEIESNNND